MSLKVNNFESLDPKMIVFRDTSVWRTQSKHKGDIPIMYISHLQTVYWFEILLVYTVLSLTKLMTIIF